jgi:hypothetical protein
MFSAGGDQRLDVAGTGHERGDGLRTPVDEPVVRLPFDPAVDADDAPGDVVVDRRLLPRQPDERDDGQAATRRDVQNVLATRLGVCALLLRREPVVLREQGPEAVRNGGRVVDQALSVLDELPERRGTRRRSERRHARIVLH